MADNTNIIRIPSSLEDSFFIYWFEFLKPFHKLQSREIEVAAKFLKARYELSKVIKDDDILDEILFSDNTKRKIKEECNLTKAHFQQVIRSFRNKKIIVDGTINKKFIPNIKEDAGSFKLTLFFEFI